MSIPTFGTMNGVLCSTPYSPIDPALETVVAVMYNYYDPALLAENSSSIITNSSNRVSLNPYGIGPDPLFDGSNCSIDGGVSYMELDSFLALFFPTNAGYFNVNPTNSSNPAVVLSKQTYATTNNQYDKFSLVQFLLRAYCTNKGINVNDIDPRIVILLQKEAFAAQSLATIKGTTISMSWDEVINSLIRSGLMAEKDSQESVYAPLAIVLNYHSFVLDTDLSIKFTYYVKVSGYSSNYPAAQPPRLVL